MPTRTLAAFFRRVDSTSLLKAARGTIASLLAYSFAAMLHLEGPYWAAMTVWIVAQPSRGMLLGKSAARVVGTVAGVMAALPLAWLASKQPQLFVFSLALWVGCCAAIATTLTGFRVYVAVLGGFTASLIAISVLHHPHMVVELATSRVACILIGIFASALMTWLWTPRSEFGVLRQRVERTVDEACQWLGHVLAGGEDRPTMEDLEAKLGKDMATIEAQCSQSSGVSSVRAERRCVRTVLICVMDTLCAASALPERSMFSSAIRRSTQDPKALLDALTTVQFGLLETDSAFRLSRALERLILALDAMRGPHAATRPAELHPLNLHVDWRHALRQGARTSLLLGAIGAAWLLTGSELLLGALMGASILCSIFSTVETAAQATIGAVKGTFAGTAAAVFFIGFIGPHVHSLEFVVLVLAPFAFLGGLALSDKLLGAMAMDYNMVFWLLVGPTLGTSTVLPEHLQLLAGPLLGAMATAFAFRFIFPSDPMRQLGDLAAALDADVQRIALGSNVANLGAWQARLLHRGLRLVVLATRTGQDPSLALRTAIRTLNAGFDALRLRASAMLDAPSRPERRAIDN